MNDTHSILVVDDELLIRDLLYDFFSGQGWKVSVAENGSRALDIMANREIDLVLSDIKMPDFDGLALTEQIAEEHPDVPVVLMTGYPSVETAVSALRAKVVDYVIKPFNINQLYKTVAAAVEEQTA
jgi:DNA-binding NtrC family response regulator